MFDISNLAFADGVPSIFILASPLQTICAVEAIKKYKIEDYKIILVLGNDIRNAQVYELLEKCGLVYEIQYDYDLVFNKLSVLKRRKNKYKRVYIGDPRSLFQVYVGLNNCSDNASFVMMDDGNDNIFMLKGYSFFEEINIRTRLSVFFYYRIVPLLRGISFGKDLFTIYSNIPNCRYRIESNNFEYFASFINTNSKSRGVYFIGTNHNRYCEPQNYPEERVAIHLEDILIKLKKEYPDEEIYYIPHGRDTATFPIELCRKYSIQYIRPSKTIELMFIDQGIRPKVVYGLTSTALYNIKLLFPEAVVVNVVFNVSHSNIFIKQNEVVSDYYRNQGIKEMRVDI